MGFFKNFFRKEKEKHEEEKLKVTESQLQTFMEAANQREEELRDELKIHEKSPIIIKANEEDLTMEEHEEIEQFEKKELKQDEALTHDTEEKLQEEKKYDDKCQKVCENEKAEKDNINNDSTEKDTMKYENNLEDNKEKMNAEQKMLKKGFFSNLRDKLSKSREGLFGTIKSFIMGRNVIDDEMYEELEDILIQSDIGMNMTVKIIDTLSKEIKKRHITDPKMVYPLLKEIMQDFLIKDEKTYTPQKLNVILVVGVNGVGKTTTIGKLALKCKQENKKVILGAGDTFRAAAIEQLEEWAKRANVPIVKSHQGADPGAVVFDTLTKAKNENMDIAIIDTAGRLHNKTNLMNELSKIDNIIKKQIGNDDYETLLVIDGTTGQNGLNQAKVFNDVTNLTGFIITKLDGTAKGGIVFSISDEIKKPIKYIGVGEKMEDLRDFDAKEYIDAIFD